MGRKPVRLIQKANGLNYQYDPLEAPEGSYTVADNVLANREGLLESRRGVARYGGGVLDQLHQWSFEDNLDDSVGSMTLVPSGVPTYAAGGIIDKKVDGNNFLSTAYGTFPTDWSIAIWVQYDHNPVAGHYVTRMTGPAPPLTFGLYGQAGPGNRMYWSSTGAGWTSNVWLGNRIINQWALVVFGYEDSGGRWFVTIDAGPKTWTVDAFNRDPAHTWTMSYPANHFWIDEVSFFDRVVTDAEIAAMWNGGAGARPTGSGSFKAILKEHEYQDALQRHCDGGLFQYDSGAGAFVRYGNRIYQPDTNIRIRNQESRKQNFITTSLGPFSQDTLTQDPTRAGIEPFLELTLSLTGTGNGPATPNSQTGYRAVWGRENLNQRILRGTPSQQERVTSVTLASTYTSVGAVVTVTTPTAHGYNIGDVIEITGASDATMNGPATVQAPVGANNFDFTHVAPPAPANGTLTVGKAWDVQIDFPIPDDVVAGDWYEIYRTLPSASQTDLPGEEHFRVKQNLVTAADITAGVISFTDTVVDSLLEKTFGLYTNPSLGAGSRNNDRPPFAIDLCEFQGHMHYAGATWEQEREFTLKDVTNIVAGVSWISFGGEQYTFAAAENVGLKQFQLFAPTTAANIASTMKSLVRVINRASTIYYAFYVSDAEGAPGTVVVRHRALNGSSFALLTDIAATGASFDPEIPISGTLISSEAPGGDNILARSKFEQPEAVPRLSTDPIGLERKKIQRILSLRDVVVILKDLDGFYVETGETDGTIGNKFLIKERDRSLHIFGRDTAKVLQNQVICYSNQGFVSINENGAKIIGRQVEQRLEEIRAVSDWDNLAFALSHESEDMYMCFGPELATDTVPTLCWTYNVLNKKFVNSFRKRCSAGHVLSIDDKIYLAHADDHYTLQERKSLDLTGVDYMDEEIDITINVAGSVINADGIQVSLLDVVYSYAGATIGEGFRVSQGGKWTTVVEATDIGGGQWRLECEEYVSGFTAGAATVFLPIYVSLRSVPVFGTNAALLKQYVEVHFEFENDRAFSHYVAFSTDLVPEFTFNDEPFTTLPPNAGWGMSPWGPASWGDPGELAATPLIVPVTKDHARARRFDFLYQHYVAGEKVSLSQITVLLREISLRSSYKVSS